MFEITTVCFQSICETNSDKDFFFFKDFTIVLREGSLASTLFSDTPVLSKMIPTEFLNNHESKWRSRGDLLENGKIVDSAWAIHEVVSWGK